MKILQIGDIHFGEKGNSEVFNNQILDFIDWACGVAKDRNITTCVQLGDYFHERNKVNVATLNAGIAGAIQLQQTFGRENVFVLAGNHDVYYKDRVDVSSVNVLAPYVTVISEPTVIPFENKTVVMIPWIVDNEMWDKIVSMGDDNDYLYSHLELNGFKVNDQYTMEHGYSPKELKRYKRVLTGHYHSPQQMGNIQYAGTPFPISMNEANEAHGVWIHDTETDDLEFIEYTGLRIVSISYTEISSLESYDPATTTVRLEFPDDLEDENLIEECKKLLEDSGFENVKTKYRGKKLQELLEQDTEVVEVENIDHFVMSSLSAMTDVVGVSTDKLNKLYKLSIERSEEGVKSE